METFMNLFVFMMVLVEVLLANDEDLQPFGSGKSQLVDKVEGFPSPEEFLRDFLSPLRPLLMKNAAKQFPAFQKWSDAYLQSLNVDPAEDAYVHIELGKKEDRTHPSQNMHFHDFLKTYNNSDIYLVQQLPSYLKKDILLPWPLQCPSWSHSLGDVILWFSSGDTSSVIHTDSAENINCVLRGRKTLVLVNPAKYKANVPLYPNGTYSPLDVDKVDLNKYPSMKGVEYYHVNMEPGDCLYIPVEWIHQVRSYGSNIAVNFWFDRRILLPRAVSLQDILHNVSTTCSQTFNEKHTLEGVKLYGLDEMEFLQAIRTKMEEKNGSLTLEDFRIMLLEVESRVNVPTVFALANDILKEVFYSLDSDNDQMVTEEDLMNISSYNLKRAVSFLGRLEHLLTHLHEIQDPSSTEKTEL